MTDIREQIISTKPSRIVPTFKSIPRNCIAGRCGHTTIQVKSIMLDKEIVLKCMDEYAIKILKFLMDNSEDFDFISDKLPVNEVLESIKRHLK